MKHHKHKGSSEHRYKGEIDVMGHGSPHATHEIHGGHADGPRELEVGASPGRSTTGIKPYQGSHQFEGGSKTSGKAKGLKTGREDDEG